ncbi:MAG: fimbria/pilus outer membrane usher protein [Aquisalimonadaceae bacterium]
MPSMPPSGWNKAAGYSLTLALLLTAASATNAADDKAVGVVCVPEVQEHWLQSALNGHANQLHMLVLEHASGQFLIRELDLLELGIPFPSVRPYRYRQELFYPTASLPELGFLIQPDRDTIAVEVPTNTRWPLRRPRGILAESAVEELWLPVTLDGARQRHVALVLRHGDGRRFVRRLDLLELGLALPPDHPYRYRQEDFFSVGDSPSLNIVLRRQHLEINRKALPEDCLLPPPVPDLTPSPEQPRQDESEIEFEELLVGVTLNGQTKPGVILALRQADGSILLPINTLRDYRIRLPDGPGIEHYGRDYLPLSHLDGITADLNTSRMELGLSVTPSMLESVTLRPPGREVGRPTSSTGAFFNYELFAEHVDDSRVSAPTHGGGVFELGLFGGPGVFTNTAIYRRDNVTDQWARLESAWRRDNHERTTTTIVGDAIGQPGSWGNPVRYGGVSWGTNFATRPDLITFPLPTIAGETATASTVDVYVNNVRRFSTDVPEGPFTIDEIPIVTGAGDIRLVTRDVLGREQVVTQPFYGSNQLLQKTLYAFNYTAGMIRQSYGTESFDYGDAFASTTHRYGFSNWFTGELRGEFSADWQSVGAAGSVAVPGLGALHLAGAGSRDRQGRIGHLGEASLERRGRIVSVGGRIRIRDAGFRQLGQIPGADARTTQAFARFRLGRAGSLSFSYLARQLDDDHTRIAGAGFSTRLGRWASLFVNALHTLDDDAATLYTANIIVPLGRGTNASMSARQRGEARHGRLSVQHNPPAAGGPGVRAVKYVGDRTEEELHTVLQRSTGTYRAAVVRNRDSQAYRASARGSIARLGGRTFAADWISGSFAAVEVPGLGDVPVYRDNLPVTQTGADGWTLINGLRAFEANRVKLDERDLPMDLQLDARPVEDVVPRYRSGVIVSFPLKRERSALLTIVSADGTPLPAGATIMVDASGERFPMGWNGQTYVTGLETRSTLTAYWSGNRCALTVDYPHGTDDPIPEVGPLVCEP